MSRVFTTSLKRKMEKKLRASDARAEKAKLKAELEPDLMQPVPPLLITLTAEHGLGEIPAGYRLLMPHNIALELIRSRQAHPVPVGSFDVQPDMVLTEDILRVCLPAALFDRLENLCEVHEVAVCI
jgi:hypothetical protein